MHIIGITGTIGAGKGEAVSYFKQKGFEHFSARDFLRKEVEKRNLPLIRDSFVVVANELRKEYGPAYVIESLYEGAKKSSKDSVIESIRATAEIDFLKKQPDFTLLAIDADQNLRYERVHKRGSETDDVSLEKFITDEQKEMSSDDPTKQNLSACIRRADVIITNNGTIEEFYQKLNEVFAI